MRILIFSQYFWPENFAINRLAFDLKKSGHCVDVITGMPNYPDGIFFNKYGGFRIIRERWKNIDIFRIPIIPRGKKRGVNLFLNYVSFVISGSLISPFLLKKRRYDIVFVYGVSPITQALPAIFIGKLKGASIVLWVQDLWPESISATGYIKSKLVLNILSLFVKFIYKHSDLILGQSKGFVKHIKKLTKTKVFFFPNSVDDSFFRQRSIFNARPSAKFSVVYAGNVGHAQGIEIFVEAAKKLKGNNKIEFVIYGAGSLMDWVKDQKKIFKINNLILGGVYPIESMPQILAKSSILFLSLKSEDVFKMTIPNKLQAYLAVGRPILGVIDGEAAQIIRDSKAGVCVNSSDLDGLVSEVVKFYKMPEDQLQKMGMNGKVFFKANFDSMLLIKKLESMLIDVKK